MAFTSLDLRQHRYYSTFICVWGHLILFSDCTSQFLQPLSLTKFQSATTQLAYDRAQKELYIALASLESGLQQSRFLVGDR